MTRHSILAVTVLLGAIFSGATDVWAQEVLMPEQSAAKAKQLIQQAIQALGGNEYLNVRDATCTGRLSQFGHSGELTGYEKFIDYSVLPDKDRTENLPKRNLIEVTNGDHGWVLDRGGVTETPDDVISQNRDNLKQDLDYVLRHRLTEQGMIFRYAGTDVVDLKEAEWVELTDSEGRTIRIALDKYTHLPIRKVVVTRDPASRLRTEVVEYYSNYHPLQGIQTPFQITRERNTVKVFQVFFDECKYNTGLSDSLFTRQSLEERFSQVGKKEKKKG